MGTRAVYTFKGSKGDNSKFHVYGHWDGYPTGAADKIAKALPFAWPLPRYDVSDFAAAFVAGNKTKGEGGGCAGGNIYLTRHFNDHGDLDYRYEIEFDGKALLVTAYEAHGGYNKEPFRWHRMHKPLALNEFTKLHNAKE